MMRAYGRKLLLSIVILWPGAALAQQTYRLPQIANGAFPGGSFRTTFLVFNVTDARVSVVISLVGDDGRPLSLTVPGFQTSDRFTLSLEGGETRLLQTDGSGAAVSGAATVTASGDIGISAIFSVFDERGNFLTEAGVGSSEPMTEFVLPVEVGGGVNTGVAFFSEATGALLNLRLVDPAGQEVSQRSLVLPANGHAARFLAGPAEFFPQIVSFRGTLRVTSTAPVSAATLRQNASPLALTTLPVVSTASTRTEFSMAQIADGPIPGGSLRTSFFIFNTSAASASVVLALARDDGSPMTVALAGIGSGSRFSFNLPPGASAFVQTDGSGPLAAGSAAVTSSAPVGVSAVFSILGSNGRLITEAGVGDSPLLTRFSLPVEARPGLETGAAFFNRGGLPAALRLNLLDSDGSVVASRELSVTAGGHLALFASEIFPGFFTRAGSLPSPTIREFRGSLTVAASAPIAALALRQNSSPLSFTTLPIAGQASQGRPSADLALLRHSVSQVAVTGDFAIDAVLQPGLRLSGTVRDSEGPVLVTARGERNTFYASQVDPETRRYLMVVPADRYRLLMCHEPPPVLPTGTVRVTFDDPDSVVVNTDTVRDIRLPLVPVVQVTGTVAGLGVFGNLNSPLIALGSNDGQVGAALRIAADGTFQGRLPVNSYTATLMGQLQDPVPQTLSLFGIGAVSVSASTVANFTVPATSTLTGTVRGASAGTSVRLSASDLSVPPLPLGCAPTSSVNSTTAPEPARAYRVVLVPGRTHSLAVTVPVVSGQQTVGSLTFPVPSRQVSINGNTSQDFDVPLLPPLFVLSGRVTDSNGAPASGATVSASTSEIAGLVGAAYSTSALTAADGSFRMELLAGTGYDISFQPRLPRLP